MAALSAPLWRAEEARAATGGEPAGGLDWAAGGVSIDTRTLAPGDLFVALRGPNFDGADFLDAAFEKGAAAAIATRASAAGPVLIVDDPQQALESLGFAARARSKARIAAITGSVGKTGVKDALAGLLAAQAPTHKSGASHNNHWGVPLSLARLPEEARFAVFELGMNAPGEIRALTRQARPHAAAITAIAPAHIGFFESEAAIARAKAEIFEGLEPGGVALTPADGPHAAFLYEAAANAGRRLTFGESARADWRLVDVALDFEGSTIVVEGEGARHEVRLGAPGRHWASNATLLLALAGALGADVGAVARGLEAIEAGPGRGARRAIPLEGGDAVLLDESYNANPRSMEAALAVLAMAPGGKVAALGQMLELGDRSRSAHLSLLEPLKRAGVEKLFAVGPDMALLCDALAGAIPTVHAETSLDLEAPIRAALRPGDALLVKGSLGAKMGALVGALAPPPSV